MGAFKNEKNGTWYVQFRYTDWQGLRQQKLKRGFATKREAQEWERAFLTEKKADVTMPFKTFTELYEKDVRPKLKENTCNGVQREHNKKLNNGLPILHKVPPKRDYGRYFCIMAEKGGTSHGGLTEKLSLFFHAKKQEVNAYGR